VLVFSSTLLREGATGIKTFYDLFRSQWGERVRFYKTNTMRRYKKATAATLDMLPLWLQEDRSRDVLGIELHGGQSARDMQPPGFELLSDYSPGAGPHSYCRMVLPLQWFQEKPMRLVELARTCVATFPLSWGHAGYSLFWDQQDVQADEEAAEHLRGVLKKYPAVSYGRPLAFVNPSPQGVLDFNWLTFLGSALTAKLGGREKVAKGLPSSVGVELLASGGLLLRAGAAPAWGAGDSCDAYRSVAQVLKPVRAPESIRQIVRILPLEDSEMEAWLDRFFK
jgi:hypothetical protein